ncbi:metallophosphoesterase family protein [Corynebacterium ulceribovis]|uniref:metallophosphoesterase family protein n=1 Tax=Corynebacterium ulceribovis TaxID=487732 RepID=UPI000369E699|nr:metallophosphoesterase [Corynebacterium ulceribovis]
MIDPRSFDETGSRDSGPARQGFRRFDKSSPAQTRRSTARATMRAGRIAGALLTATIGTGLRAVVPDTLRRTKTDEPLSATDLEIVTVTDDSVTFCWATYPGRSTRFGKVKDTVATTSVVRMAKVGEPLRIVHDDPIKRGYHFATIVGLEADTEYDFECSSEGAIATPGLTVTRKAGSPEQLGRIRTLPKVPGDYITTIAIANDTHIGEDEQGQLVGDMPLPDIREEGANPYPEVMVRGMLEELKLQGVKKLLVNGDLTAQARPREVLKIKELLDSFGQQGVDWFAVRGNHDRPHRPSFDPEAGYEDWPKIPGTVDHHDPFGEVFALPRQEMWVTEIGKLRVIGLDSCQLDNSGGIIEDSQFRQLAAELAQNPDQPTLMIAHHPVTREAAWTNMSGPFFVLRSNDSARLQKLHLGAPGVFMMAAGHTHRVRRTKPDTAAHVDYVELGASAGYPGGYTLVHLYTGGFRVNFHRVSSEEALRWAARSRWAAYGIQPEYTLGSVEDRNYVVERDLSSLVDG